MKTLMLYLTAIVGLCVSLSSCKLTTGMEPFERDMSLAGSVSYGYAHYKGRVECKYDGLPVCDGVRYSYLHLTKVSDEEVSLFWGLHYGDTLVVNVSIPRIPLSGVPSDVLMDYSSSDAEVRINDVACRRVRLLVRVWVKEIVAVPQSRFSPYMPDFECEVDFQGKVDNKDFNLMMSGTTRL